MGERKANNPADPWSYNAFEPPTDVAPPPSGLTRPHHLKKEIPFVDDLMRVQRDIIKALDAFTHDDVDSAEIQLENAYRILNRYLREHG